MNAPTKLTAAPLRRFLLVAALLICPLLANAQSVATGSLTSGGMSTITIGQNQQFTMTLGVTTNFVSSGYTVFYSIGGGGAGFFGMFNAVDNPPGPPIEITPRTNLNTILNDPTTGDLVAFNGPGGFARFTSGPGSNSNQFDLGYTGDQVNNQPAGMFNLQSIMVNSLNAAPGTYTIFLDARSVLTDRTGGGFFDVNFGAGQPGSPVLTVNVIPEPATVGLAIVGGALLLVVGWRKRVRA